MAGFLIFCKKWAGFYSQPKYIRINIIRIEIVRIVPLFFSKKSLSPSSLGFNINIKTPIIAIMIKAGTPTDSNSESPNFAAADC
jgi:hypothetical protein